MSNLLRQEVIAKYASPDPGVSLTVLKKDGQ